MKEALLGLVVLTDKLQCSKNQDFYILRIRNVASASQKSRLITCLALEAIC